MANLCPGCGNAINLDSYCKVCHKSINVFKKAENISKVLYNQGLELAAVRDLSSAITLLQRSLRFDKNNVQARNLLGLLFFEIGDTVEALKHWVFSASMQPNNNLASYYLNIIKDNQHHLEKLNNAIKKYNQSLTYIRQNSPDLAVIQLKKVISLNPRFISAYNLLALCYMKEQSHEKARRTLLKVLAIDKSNYLARKYYSLADLSEDIVPDVIEAPSSPDPSRKLPLPLNNGMNHGVQQLLVLGLGVLMGLAVMAFLVLPKQLGEKETTIDEMKTQVATLQEQYATTTSDLEDQTEKLETAHVENQELRDNLTYARGVLTEVNKVLLALNYYLAGEKITAANELYLVNEQNMNGAAAMDIYIAAKDVIFADVARSAYNTGSNYYRNYGNAYLPDAIEHLEAAIQYGTEQDFMHLAHYYLAQAYRRTDDTDLALIHYQIVIDAYPNSSVRADANWWIGELNRE